MASYNKYPSLKGKVVIITGASSGIGAATAVVFAEQGSKLTVVGRNEANLNKVVQDCITAGASTDQVLPVVGDISKEADVDRMISETINKYDCIDVLINNAGVCPSASLTETTVQGFDQVIDINVRGTFMCTHKAAPHLIKSKGNIINVSSNSSILPDRSLFAYCTSKAAVDMLTQCTAADLAPHQVRVNAMSPGVTKTPIFERAGFSKDEADQFLDYGSPMGRAAEPSEMARVMAFLASDDASFVNGANILVDGAYMTALDMPQK